MNSSNFPGVENSNINTVNVDSSNSSATNKLCIMIFNYEVNKAIFEQIPDCKKENNIYIAPDIDAQLIIQYDEDNKMFYAYEVIESETESDIVNKFLKVLGKYLPKHIAIQDLSLAFHISGDIAAMEKIFYHMYPILYLIIHKQEEYKGSQMLMTYTHPYRQDINVLIRLSQPRGYEVIAEFAMIQTINGFINLKEVGNDALRVLKEIYNNATANL